MADILSFSIATPKRALKGERRSIEISELQSYLPMIRESIENWRVIESGGSTGEEFDDELNLVTKKIMDCFRAFIVSGGQWRGQWPAIMRFREFNFAERCIWQIRVDLMRYCEGAFTRALLDEYEIAALKSRAPRVRFNRDFHTFVALNDFAADMWAEVNRQNRITAS